MRTGDSGTSSRAATAVGTAMIAADQKIHCVGEVVDDRSAHDQAGASTDLERCRDQPDRAGHAIGRKLVANDSDRERQDASADALQQTPGHHDLDAVPESRDHAAEPEDRERGHEHPPLAEHVAQPAGARRRHEEM
jgi:hypothetical protein